MPSGIDDLATPRPATRETWTKAGPGIRELASIEPMLVAAYIEQRQETRAKPSVKQHLAAIRMLFDWLVTGRVMLANPAHALRPRA
jgi:site-specific recombinase XerD